MKTEKELKKIAKEVAKLEKILQNPETKDNILQATFLQIEEIMENLSIEEGLELDVMVRDILKKE